MARRWDRSEPVAGFRDARAGTAGARGVRIRPQAGGDLAREFRLSHTEPACQFVPSRRPRTLSVAHADDHWSRVRRRTV